MAETMVAYIREGRIVEDSMLSQNPANGFMEARHFGFYKTQSLAAPKTAPSPHHKPGYAPQTQDTPTPATPLVFLIMAEINSDADMKFLHRLQNLGQTQRIGDTVWLLKANIPITIVQQQLAQTLMRQDRLFILDSFNNKTAWHNIGADMDQRIREMWGL